MGPRLPLRINLLRTQHLFQVIHTTAGATSASRMSQELTGRHLYFMPMERTQPLADPGVWRLIVRAPMVVVNFGWGSMSSPQALASDNLLQAFSACSEYNHGLLRTLRFVRTINQFLQNELQINWARMQIALCSVASMP